MAIQIRKATAKRSKVRIALAGPAGSGKTFGGLLVAHGLGKRIGVIDTEVRLDQATGLYHGRSEQYAGLYSEELGGPLDFDVIALGPPYSPERYREALEVIYRNGYDVALIDSLSHEWAGKGGVRDMVDDEKSRSRGNEFSAWKEPSRAHEDLVEAIVTAPIHVICTMRSKMAYELVENERGKKVPVKLGLAPIQRDNVEYEFDVIWECDLDHSVSMSKCNANYSKPLREALQVTRRLTVGIGAKLQKWAEVGIAPPQSSVQQPSPPAPRVEPAATTNAASTAPPSPAAASAPTPPSTELAAQFPEGKQADRTPAPSPTTAAVQQNAAPTAPAAATAPPAQPITTAAPGAGGGASSRVSGFTPQQQEAIMAAAPDQSRILFQQIVCMSKAELDQPWEREKATQMWTVLKRSFGDNELKKAMDSPQVGYKPGAMPSPAQFVAVLRYFKFSPEASMAGPKS
jgi:hypothetical protein